MRYPSERCIVVQRGAERGRKISNATADAWLQRYCKDKEVPSIFFTQKAIVPASLILLSASTA